MVRDQRTAGCDNKKATSACPQQYSDQELSAATQIDERRVGNGTGLQSHNLFCALGEINCEHARSLQRTAKEPDALASRASESIELQYFGNGLWRRLRTSRVSMYR